MLSHKLLFNVSFCCVGPERLEINFGAGPTAK